MNENLSKRYTLVLPEGTFNKVEDVADKMDTTVAATLRKFIILGLKVTKAQDQGGILVKRVGTKETELLII